MAWKTFTRKPATSESQRRSANRLPGNSRNLHQLRERNIQRLELYSDTNFELEDEDLGESYHSLNQRD